ncbi:unnamed protein product [Brugia timori]|uniref:Uncharacterized protein n=1 Tax=Brugia timori TaxID=42155 RepID=A0A0R3R8Q8_9BILA|nr:unnamed protein product [Brugia timori]
MNLSFASPANVISNEAIKRSVNETVHAWYHTISTAKTPEIGPEERKLSLKHLIIVLEKLPHEVSICLNLNVSSP